jgi:c-di-GMP phosphodiesterase
MPGLLIARQPIFDTSLDVVGYELLYQAQPSNGTYAPTNDPAVLKGVLDQMAQVGLENLVGQKKAFIDTSRNFLTSKYPIPLPAASMVLEVLSDVAADTASLELLTELSQQGYQIAVQKLVSVAKVSKLLGLAHIVKIDLSNLDRMSLADTISRLKLHRVKLLANRVETLDDLAYCQRVGFDYYQGYFLCKPRLTQGRRLDASRAVVMRSLAQIQDSSADFQSLAKIISQDVSLSYKLLKLVNSAYYSLSKTITSLEQAVALIGLNQLRGWMTLILMASVRNKPYELTTLALARAKMCELLAQATGERQTDAFFLVGLFSILDALMDLPMQEAIATLPLADDIIQALIRQHGKLGDVLKMVLIFERGLWDSLPTVKTGLTLEVIGAAYLKAICWTTETMRAMNN